MAKGKKTGGRRPKLTAEVQERIVSAIRAGNYANVAAEYAGISEGTFYRWLAQGQESKTGIYREFRESVKKAEREAEVRAVAIIQRHMETNWQAAMTYLERKYPNRWGRRDRITMEMITIDQAATWFQAFGASIREVMETEWPEIAPAALQLIEERCSNLKLDEVGRR